MVRNDTQTDCEAFSSRPILLEFFDIVSQILSAIIDAACNSIYKNRNKNDSLLGSLDIGLFVTLEAWFQLFTCEDSLKALTQMVAKVIRIHIVSFTILDERNVKTERRYYFLKYSDVNMKMQRYEKIDRYYIFS